jgi:spore germination protein GerM
MKSAKTSYLFRRHRLTAAAILATLGFSLGLAMPMMASSNRQVAIAKTIITPSKTKTIQVYLLSANTNKLVPVAHSLTAADLSTPEASLKSALHKLLAKPQQKSLISAIPTGTKLIDLKIKGDQIHINLSSEFANDGGAFSMVGRVGQVVYTATSLNKQAQVFLSVDGKLISDRHPLGNKGLELRQPMSRQEFKTEFTTSFKR